MPAEERSLAITDAYRARALELRRRALVFAVSSWDLDELELDDSFLAWLAAVELVAASAQSSLASLSDGYVAAFVSSELGEAVPPVGVDASSVAGVTLDGRPLRELLAGSLIAVKRELGRGRPFAEASSSGQARAVRNLTTELDGAADRALDDALERQPRVRGWRRVTSRRACGACLGSATGSVQKTSALLLRHPHCRCTKEPVVAGAGDRIRRPTGAETFAALSPREQDALFAGRGGKQKAELVRSGKVELDELVSVDRQALDGRPSTITETPLEHLSR